ncbi:cobalt-zinc-cadmium efflux system membrane fusion protein [Methylohalomonas lacus]|uniref:Cobalt-zinc-cadmium efflux system membrane fusion protein n=1 Tax=Methylohalomonas lacus TaxID=398773 RepID=A0AAE3HLY3_9GAMM|nr:efflux RND transporter periplasmic adaptor subunit [Methylohalomonas lacus]MCS3902882.1 cobalt-zinc-cadmium efflux system membrane fusion protein [Methylohalomonas lacus]
MKILMNVLLLLAILLIGAYAGQQLLQSSPAKGSHRHDAGTAEHAGEQTGPHGGRLLEAGDFQLEVTIYERGVPPEFRVYAYRDGEPLAAEAFDLKIELARLGGKTDRFTFQPRESYRVSNETVTEPHSFDVRIKARHNGRDYDWRYAQHEGRTRISQTQAEAAGIETAIANPATIHRTVTLQGRIQYDPGRMRQVRARYAGVIRSAGKAVGDRVQADTAVARVESNDSLQSYAIKAPISGVVIAQQAGAGEAVSTDQSIYTIANLDHVWLDLAVFREQLDKIRVGQSVQLQSLDGNLDGRANIDYLLPVTDGRSQATTARVYLDNPDGHWRPGTAVTAEVTIEETDVPLAVRNSALQTFRDFDVVFARFGDTYEVRMLELGRSDATHTEVIGGLDPGTEYVVDNSYLLKADIEKSGAEHAH